MVVLALSACDGPGAPNRPSPYEFRLDPPDDFVFHWEPEHLPVRYYVAGGGALSEYTATGLATWERQFLYGEFRGVLAGDSTDADVIVRWQIGPPPEAPLTNDPPLTSCQGVTRLPNLTDAPAFQDKLRVEIAWFAGETPTDIANCAARVVTHELGHTLGIFRHSLEPTDLMSPDPVVGTPSSRDRATVEYLYHLPTQVRPATER